MKDKTIKLGDFGVARVLSKTKSVADTITGTPVYISPEMLDFNENMDGSKGYSFGSDIWSLGVLLYEIITKDMPFDGDDMKSLFDNISKGKYKPIPKTYSADLSNLVGAMLQKDPANRPTINQLLKSNMLKDRISKFMDKATMDGEFEHTVMHGQNIFEGKN